ncbi:MAG: c-type cytochrome [Holophagaceae bacterium]|nr:c-type cytochrome [Holophagaceae bacterium]
MTTRFKLPIPFSAVSTALAILLALAAIGCSDHGLTTKKSAQSGPAGLTKAEGGGAPSLEIGSDSVFYPNNMPSALKGRQVYNANCATCHGTYLTAQERLDLSKEAALPADKQVVRKGLEKEGRMPETAPLNGPNFNERNWRFQRTPGQLFQLIAYGSMPEKLGIPNAKLIQHPGPVLGPDKKPLKDASGKLQYKPGLGWMDSIQTQRGGLEFVSGDSVPVWDSVFYVWSRSIAAKGVTNFSDVWKIYGENCSVCHGDIAKGNGPLSRQLNPLPFNFQNRKAMAETTDQFLFWRISEGGQFRSIPPSIKDTMSSQALGLYVHQWSAMPSWRGMLTEEQRWMLVDGVRSKTYEHE